AAERERIAEYFISKKQWETAIPYLLDAESYDRAAEVIAETGPDWVAAGAYTSLRLFTDRIPSESLERSPRSLLFRAETLRLHGEIQDASATLRRAVNLLNENGDTAGEAEALHSLATIARRRGSYSDAYSYLDKAVDLANEDSETFIKCANTRGLC